MGFPFEVALLAVLVLSVSGGPVSTETTDNKPVPTTLPSDFSAGLAPYRPSPSNEPTPTGDASTQNRLGTYLYKYDGCDSTQKSHIDDAYYDAWVMANTGGVLSDINWNEAAALEFLGAPGLNQPEQSQIQAVLANMATVIYSYKNIFQHAIHVRCDDPRKRCQNRPDQDPCNPTPPNPGEKPKPTPLAYALNVDPDDSYPMINFCDGFHKRRSLGNAIAYGTGLKSPENLKLSSFDNRAQTFFHELTHLDLAADSPDPNPGVTDLTIAIKFGNTGKTYNTVAYGPLGSKLLARCQTKTGFYVQRNADNLAYFALAKYVMTKNENIYPHLPIVTNEIEGTPWLAPPGLLAEFVKAGESAYLNMSGSDITALTAHFPELGDYPGCPDDENGAAGPLLTVDSLAPNSAYPADYISQVSSWISSLATSSPSATSASPSSTTSPTAAYATGTCHFHIKEYQDCSDDSQNLYAVIDMQDNAGNSIGSTQIDPAKNPIGDPVNAKAPLSFASKLAYPLIVTGEHQNDYIQFSLGSLSWTSRDTTGPAHCKNGGWDPRQGPICGQLFGLDTDAENQLDCWFPC